MGKWLAANRVTVNHSNSHSPTYSLLSPGTAVFPLVWRNVQTDQQVCNTAGRSSTSNLTAVNPQSFLSISQCSFFEHTLQLQVWSANYKVWYTRVNKNPSAWNFLSPKPEVTCGTVAMIIRFVLLSPYLRIRAVSLSSIHYNQSHRVYINRRRQYICLIWN